MDLHDPSNPIDMWLSHFEKVESPLKIDPVVEDLTTGLAHTIIEGWDFAIQPYIPPEHAALLKRVFYRLLNVSALVELAAVGLVVRKSFTEEEGCCGTGILAIATETEALVSLGLL